MLRTALPAPMAPLAVYSQFIVCRKELITLANGDTKWTKVPIDPRTGKKCDAHDPKNQMSFGNALEATLRFGENCGVGFAFRESDSFFFIDIDHALQPDGSWSDFAQQIYAAFPGAVFEISLSGTGFHIFGRYDHRVEHATNNAKLGLELYVAGRFVALTGVECEGSFDINYQAQYEWLASTYLPVGMDADIDWNDEADPEWRGPAEDDELIARMLRSKASGAAAFGKACTVQQLWEADGVPLGNAFPDAHQGRDYDASSADMALCMHLAFWTGKNCERMCRLFERSSLMREKWTDRPDYQYKTITKAAAGCSGVYTEHTAKLEPPAEPVPIAAIPDGVGMREGFQFLTVPQQLEYFKGCVYVIDRDEVFMPDGTFLNQSRFKVVKGGYVFAMDHDSGDNTKSAWDAFTQTQALTWQKVHSARFLPETPPGTIAEEEGWSFINSYVPAAVRSIAGDVTPFLKLLEINHPIERDREILLAYMAAVVQHVGVKFQWSPVIQGTQGNGKSFFATAVAAAIGRRFTHTPNPRDLANKFNYWLDGKLFISVEEIWQRGRSDIAEALKPMITNLQIEMQRKSGDQYLGDNRANFMMFSNHKDAVAKTEDDRRYCVFYCAQQTAADIVRDGLGGNYFPNLYRWARDEGGYAMITHYLRSYAIPDEFNPAGSCHRAPMTSSTVAAIAASRTDDEEWILEAIASGVAGFQGGWVSSVMHSAHLKTLGVRDNFRERAAALENLGYVHHPALTEGRAGRRTAIDGNKRPVLWVKPGSIQAGRTGAAIVQFYEKAQQTEPAIAVPAGEINAQA